MRKKGLIAILCALLVALPLGAVFQEDNLNHTLTVLLMELKESYANLIRISGSAEKRIQEQHEKLASLVDECNELSVMLYSQASENTFDLTFALNEITKQYQKFKGQNTPYAEIKATLTAEMDRYNRTTAWFSPSGKCRRSARQSKFGKGGRWPLPWIPPPRPWHRQTPCMPWWKPPIL